LPVQYHSSGAGDTCYRFSNGVWTWRRLRVDASSVDIPNTSATQLCACLLSSCTVCADP